MVTDTSVGLIQVQSFAAEVLLMLNYYIDDSDCLFLDIFFITFIRIPLGTKTIFTRDGFRMIT